MWPQQLQQPVQVQNGPRPAAAEQNPKFEMKPIATSETKQEQRRSTHRNNGENFELENLDISPGNTLRDRRRIEELNSPTQDVVEVLQESPNAGRKRRKANDAQQVTFVDICL